MDMTENEPDRVKFHFVRSPFFRVVHSNGIWGGITPQLELSVTFYSQRFLPPQQVTHQLTPEGQLGTEIERDVTEGVQREFEVEVLMSMQEARNLQRWLGAKIDEWQNLNLGADQSQSGDIS